MAKKPKRPKNKSKFSVKETKLPTIFGMCLGVISVVTVGLLLFMTYRQGGKATLSYAFAGVLASVFSVLGLILSILCIIDHYQHHAIGWAGIVLNGIAALSMAGILYTGML